MERSEWEIGWSDYLSVGVPEMDEEHRQFIARVNELNKAVLDCADKATVMQLMDRMLSEAARHFGHEQELLARWNYPETAAHTATHAALIAKFRHVMKEIEQSDISFV